MLRAPFIASLLLVAACSTTRSEEDPWPAPTTPLDETVGWLDNDPVTYGEVARYLKTKDPEAFSRSLEGLVLERVTLREAEQLAIDVPRALVIRQTQRRMLEWEARVRAASKAQTGEEVEPALWLERVAGISVSRLRGWVERHTRVELLQDRLLRYEMLTSKRVEVSMLVAKTEAEAAALKAQADAGTSFETLASQHSIHPSKAKGGRVAFPLLQPDISDVDVRKALFSAKKDAVVGPFPTQGGGATYYQLYRVRGRQAPRQGTYGALARDVARDLEARPVDVGEYERWRRRILLRHGFVAAPAAGDPDDSAS